MGKIYNHTKKSTPKNVYDIFKSRKYLHNKTVRKHQLIRVSQNIQIAPNNKKKPREISINFIHVADNLKSDLKKM